MKVAALAAGLDHARIVGDPDQEIVSLAYHTRDAGPGALFFCVPGLTADGHDFAAQAVAAGAAALVCERELAVPATQVVVDSARRAMALMSARFYGEPTRSLRVAAVTGTNGKTTTAHLMASIFAAAGGRPALLGTVVNRIGGVERPTQLTTAESCDLQRMFRAMVDAGDDSVAMEASSHALALDRTAGVDFDAVLFTNLTRDHLDFHPSLEDYFLAKRRLFLPDERRQPHAAAVINAGDDAGRRLVDDCRPAYGEDLWTFALDGDTGAGDAAAVAGEIDLRSDASSFTFACRRLELWERLEVPVPGRFNVANATGAALTMLALGLPFEAVRRGLAATGGVPGRMEAVRAGQPFAVLVDYAHTPDSLENVLRGGGGGRLLCVFGCGGDRDRGKRPLMGALAAALADVAVVTSDNPRREDPGAIIDEIVAGIPAGAAGEVVVEPDRRAAIGLAVGRAAAGDVVVLAGKGHEDYQILGSDRVHFDDREVAREALAALGFAQPAEAAS